MYQTELHGNYAYASRIKSLININLFSMLRKCNRDTLTIRACRHHLILNLLPLNILYKVVFSYSVPSHQYLIKFCQATNIHRNL